LSAAFGVFAAGFFMRPLGSILFGYIGDKKGRKLALTISVGMMAVPTFLIGVLPTYQQTGLWASLSLVLLRLLQGLSVGGEFTTSATFSLKARLPGVAAFSAVLLRLAPAPGHCW